MMFMISPSFGQIATMWLQMTKDIDRVHKKGARQE
jgi:hypothetical protein